MITFSGFRCNMYYAIPIAVSNHILALNVRSHEQQLLRAVFKTSPMKFDNIFKTYFFEVVEAAPVEPATTAAQSLERQTKRKLSSSSSASRTSGHSSHRSRSRSRSKERLLSKLAHSGDINITTDEDDDIGGLLYFQFEKT